MAKNTNSPLSNDRGFFTVINFINFMTELPLNLKIQTDIGFDYMGVSNWKKSDGSLIFNHLEKSNWAPWLAASARTLASRSQVFPQGQLVLKDAIGTPLASLSTNQIMWNGNPQTLQSWDGIAGEPTTYETTYIPAGNTLVLMSMNVHPKYQGKGLARVMIEEIKKVAQSLGVTYLIG